MIFRVYKAQKYFFDPSVKLEISPAQIKLTTSVEMASGAVNTSETVLSFSGLRSRPDNGGFNRWAVSMTQDGLQKPVTNVYAETMDTKLTAGEYFAQSVFYGLLQVIVRPEDTSFDDAVIYVNLTENSQFECNREFEYSDVPAVIPPASAYHPQMSLSVVSGDADGVTVQVTAPSNVNEDAYIKTDFGHAPRKIPLVNGSGTFKFSRVGMAAGETSSVKVGYRFYSNLAQITL